MAKTVTLDKAQLCEVAMDDRDLMRDLVGALIEDTEQQIPLLELAVQAEDAAKCKQIAHYSKGACANVGASSAAELLKSIERYAAQGEFEECSVALARLASEIDLLRLEEAALQR